MFSSQDILIPTPFPPNRLKTFIRRDLTRVRKSCCVLYYAAAPINCRRIPWTAAFKIAASLMVYSQIAAPQMVAFWMTAFQMTTFQMTSFQIFLFRWLLLIFGCQSRKVGFTMRSWLSVNSMLTRLFQPLTGFEPAF